MTRKKMGESSENVGERMEHKKVKTERKEKKGKLRPKGEEGND